MAPTDACHLFAKEYAHPTHWYHPNRILIQNAKTNCSRQIAATQTQPTGSRSSRKSMLCRINNYVFFPFSLLFSALQLVSIASPSSSSPLLNACAIPSNPLTSSARTLCPSTAPSTPSLVSTPLCSRILLLWLSMYSLLSFAISAEAPESRRGSAEVER